MQKTQNTPNHEKKKILDKSMVKFLSPLFEFDEWKSISDIKKKKCNKNFNNKQNL